MNVNDFDYYLPEELIAQKPAEKRDESRLLVIHRDTGALEHKHFYDVVDYLNPGDCLVMNNSKVIPARLYGTKAETGAKIEFLLIKRIEGDRWETMVRPGRRVKPGDTIVFGAAADGKKLEALAEEAVQRTFFRNRVILDISVMRMAVITSSIEILVGAANHEAVGSLRLVVESEDTTVDGGVVDTSHPRGALGSKTEFLAVVETHVDVGHRAHVVTVVAVVVLHQAVRRPTLHAVCVAVAGRTR